MADNFSNKYRIPSARLRNWDYSSEGIYFITICTANREFLLGSINAGLMEYSTIGQIVMEGFERSFAIRAELFCDAFVIMPNHLHAILRIENDDGITIETHGLASLQPLR